MNRASPLARRQEIPAIKSLERHTPGLFQFLTYRRDSFCGADADMDGEAAGDLNRACYPIWIDPP